VLPPGENRAADRQQQRAGNQERPSPGRAGSLAALPQHCEQSLLAVLVMITVDVTGDVFPDHGFDI
jgi:hypothetical protein